MSKQLKTCKRRLSKPWQAGHKSAASRTWQKLCGGRALHAICGTCRMPESLSDEDGRL